MLRHIVIAALRNMAANRLISAISILGLSVGIAAALLMALVVRNQMSFDHFIPGHERTYRLFHRIGPAFPCKPPNECGVQPQLKDEFLHQPAIENVVRMTPAAGMKFRRGDIIGWDDFAWVDTDFFSVMPVPVLHGRLADSLSSPGGIVITSAIAHKYFGRDDVLGQELTINGHALVVRAVIADLPPNRTTLDHGVFVSWRDAAAMDAQIAARSRGAFPVWLTRIYLRLKPGASFTQAQATETMWSAPFFKGFAKQPHPADFIRDAVLLPLDRVNLWEAINPGIRLRLGAAAVTGALVLLIAAINFVNLMVARAARRNKEVGVRKACGGGRQDLATHFLGETLVLVVIAAVVGLALVEWLLPLLNDFLGTAAGLEWGDTLLLAMPLALLALAVGAWPALILSSVRPALTLRGLANSANFAPVRGILVMLQFAILLILAIAGWVMWQQRVFATHDTLRVNSDQMLLVRLGRLPQNPAGGRNVREALDGRDTRLCPSGFVDPVRRLPGVIGAVCADEVLMRAWNGVAWISKEKPYTEDAMAAYGVDPRLFALYGITPLAGTLPHTVTPGETSHLNGTVINLSAARKLGFATPQDALGKSWIASIKNMTAEFRNLWNIEYGPDAIISAVIPDFSFGTVREKIPPALYSYSPWMGLNSPVVHIRLNRRDIPETLAAIDRLYAQSGIDAPLDRFFLNDHIQELYQDVIRDGEFFAGCTLLAVLLACLGLFGVAISTAERRTKEIGVRKAMGAGNAQIVALLLWQFAQPVLWANVIAWPVAWWLMRRWLAGFAYHVDLHWWVFAGASLGALAVALLTVAGQAFLTARQKPVLALRYE